MFLGDGGAATAAQLVMPQGVAVDANGNVFFADYDVVTLPERLQQQQLAFCAAPSTTMPVY